MCALALPCLVPARRNNLTVGFFAPLPPAQTGVADYADALLHALRKHGTVKIDSAGDIALYHIGNNQLHSAIYDRALANPGVVVLHDAVLQHFFLGRFTAEQYVDEFVFNYGEWSHSLAEDLWQRRARSASDPRYFAWPMLKRIAAGARAIIVHNPSAAAIVLRHAPDARIIEIPHLFVKPDTPPEVDTLRFRVALGLHPRTLLAGVFGHQRESKRLPVVLRAIRRAWTAGADARLLIAGSFASSDLERSLEGQLSDPRIIRVGHLSEPDFWRYAAAVDLCINLRYPTAAETSGIAIRLMGIGKPVVFSDGAEIARIPDNACLRIETGPSEEEMLASYIIWLAGARETAEEIGRRAAAHIAAHHAPEKIGARYWEVLEAATNARPVRKATEP
jgi:glycosyltransferase involved in cell wall biosynthesis